MNKVVKYMFIVFITILILVAIASYFNYRYDNAVGPNLITAFVGVAVSALVTLVLLKGQTKDEEEKDKNIQLFQYKRQCYTDFIRKVWACEGSYDFKRIEESMRNLIFVINKDKLSELSELLIEAKKECGTFDKASESYAKITKLLRDDLLNDQVGVNEDHIKKIFMACYYEADEKDVAPKIKEEDKEQPIAFEENSSFNNNGIQTIWEKYEKGNLQCWHFNAWDSEIQSQSLEERKDTGNALLSLFEYGEDWRTQRLQQVNKGDIVFLFYRGGGEGRGYVGMYRATGTVVVTPKGEGYLLDDTLNDIEHKTVPLEEAEQYDIYGELSGGATSVASIRVEPEITDTDMKLTYNPINVIRQTICRIGEDNVWELLHYFDKMQNV